MLVKHKTTVFSLTLLFLLLLMQNSYALIAFVHEGNIYSMDDLGVSAVQLTDSGIDSHPDVSPDGSRIVFQRNNSIYVMRSNGTDVIQLTDDEKNDLYPVWNGDATKIAFESSRESEYCYPHQMDPNGDNMTLFPFVAYAGTWHNLAYNPNGNRIALIFHEYVHTSLDLWLLGTPGHEADRVQIEGSYTASSGDPDFSPSGEYLVYTHSSGAPRIFIRDNGGEPPDSTRTPLAYEGTDPYFMSEERIVFVKDGNICTVNTDNSTFVDTGIAGSQPSWGRGFPPANLCPIESLYGEKSSEALLLRVFRDSVLRQSELGQEITALYYRWCPVINALLSRSAVAQSLLKNTVDQVLEALE